MADLGASPSETIYVGDSLSDLEAATAAGVQFLGARWSKTEAEVLAFERRAAEIGPCICVDHPVEVEQFICA